MTASMGSRPRCRWPSSALGILGLPVVPHLLSPAFVIGPAIEIASDGGVARTRALHVLEPARISFRSARLGWRLVGGGYLRLVEFAHYVRSLRTKPRRRAHEPTGIPSHRFVGARVVAPIFLPLRAWRPLCCEKICVWL